MPILNYTTKVSALRSCMEIQTILAKHGAKKILLNYSDDGKIESISFLISTPRGERAIRLPANAMSVNNVLISQKVKTTMEKSEMVAWRIVKDWVEAQMAILESEQVQMDEVFLPYMVNNRGQTIFEVYQSGQLLLEE